MQSKFSKLKDISAIATLNCESSEAKQKSDIPGDKV